MQRCRHPSPELFIFKTETLNPLNCNSFVSCTHHIRVESRLFCYVLFLIYSANLCWLKSLFTFKVITNMEEFQSFCCLFFICLITLLAFIFSVLLSSFVFRWSFFCSEMLKLLSDFHFCVYSLAIFFVDTQGVHLTSYIYNILIWIYISNFNHVQKLYFFNIFIPTPVSCWCHKIHLYILCWPKKHKLIFSNASVS